MVNLYDQILTFVNKALLLPENDIVNKYYYYSVKDELFRFTNVENRLIPRVRNEDSEEGKMLIRYLEGYEPLISQGKDGLIQLVRLETSIKQEILLQSASKVINSNFIEKLEIEINDFNDDSSFVEVGKWLQDNDKKEYYNFAMQRDGLVATKIERICFDLKITPETSLIW